MEGFKKAFIEPTDGKPPNHKKCFSNDNPSPILALSTQNAKKRAEKLRQQNKKAAERRKEKKAAAEKAKNDGGDDEAATKTSPNALDDTTSVRV